MRPPESPGKKRRESSLARLQQALQATSRPRSPALVASPNRRSPSPPVAHKTMPPPPPAQPPATSAPPAPRSIQVLNTSSEQPDDPMTLSATIGPPKGRKLSQPAAAAPAAPAKAVEPASPLVPGGIAQPATAPASKAVPIPPARHVDTALPEPEHTASAAVLPAYPANSGPAAAPMAAPAPAVARPRPVSPTAQHLPVQSDLVDVPKPHEQQAAAVLDRMRADLESARSRVTFLADQERAAWAEVDALRTKLAAAEKERDEARATAAAAATSKSKGMPIAVQTPPQRVSEQQTQATGQSLMEHDDTAVTRDGLAAIVSAVWPDGDSPLRDRPGTRAGVGPIVARVNELLEDNARLHRVIAERDATRSRLTLQLGFAQERAGAILQYYDALWAAAVREITDAREFAKHKQLQLDELVAGAGATPLPGSGYVTGSATAAQQTLDALLQRTTGISDVARRAITSAADREHTLREELRGAQVTALGHQAKTGATMALVGQLRSRVACRDAVDELLAGTPLSSWMFHAFFSGRWYKAQKDADATPLSGVSDYVGVWRGFQVHCGDLYRRVVAATPSAAKAARDADPVSSDASDTGVCLSWLALLGADALAPAEDIEREDAEADVDDALHAAPQRRPFGDIASPEWATDEARINDALRRRCGGSLPATHVDFLCFWVAFVRDAVVGVGNWAPAVDATDALHAFVPRPTESPAAATARAQAELELRCGNAEHEALALRAAVHAMEAQHAHEEATLRARCADEVAAAQRAALQRAPSTQSLFRELYTSHLGCSECGHAVRGADLVRLLARCSGYDGHASERAFLDLMLGAVADDVSRELHALCNARLLPPAADATRRAVDAAVPPLLWHAPVGDFAAVARAVSFTDETQALAMLRCFAARSVHLGSTLTHDNVHELVSVVRFVWLPSSVIEQCLAEFDAEKHCPVGAAASAARSAAATPYAALLDDAHAGVGAHAYLREVLRANVTGAARVKLAALSAANGMPGTSVEAAYAGHSLASGSVAPRASYWFMASEGSASDAVQFTDADTQPRAASALTWHEFRQLQRRLEQVDAY